MQKSFPYSPRQNIDQDSFLSRKSFYIAALVAATMTVMIGFYAGRHEIRRFHEQLFFLAERVFIGYATPIEGCSLRSSWVSASRHHSCLCRSGGTCCRPFKAKRAGYHDGHSTEASFKILYPGGDPDLDRGVGDAGTAGSGCKARIEIS